MLLSLILLFFEHPYSTFVGEKNYTIVSLNNVGSSNEEQVTEPVFAASDLVKAFGKSKGRCEGADEGHIDAQRKDYKRAGVIKSSKGKRVN